MIKYLLMVVVLYGCGGGNIQMRNDLKEFNEIQCQDWCIRHLDLTQVACLSDCNMRGKLKVRLEATNDKS